MIQLYHEEKKTQNSVYITNLLTVITIPV